MSTRTLLSALFATALTLPAALAQSTPAAAAQPAAAAPAATVQGAEPAPSPASRDKDTLSVDFPDEDIKTILRNVADLFELNLVVPDTLTGKTSIKLRDVTWEQIFTVVLSPVGYTYVKEGNIIKIVSNELLQQEPGSTEVFILNNAKAADIKPTIDGLIDAAGGGKIVIDGRSNALVITEKPSRMSRIRNIIEALDKATDQVQIETKFVEVTDRDIRNIGVNWASLSGMTLGVGNIRQNFTRSRGQDFSNGNNTNGTNSTTTSNSNSTGSNTNNNNTTNNGTNANNSLTYVTGVNPTTTFPTTLNLQTGVTTGLPTAVASTTQQSGFTPASGTTPASATAFNTFSGGNTASTNVSNSTGTTSSISDTLSNTASNAISNLASLANTGSTGRVATAVFSASDFSVVISALKTLSNTKVMSNPTVVTLNNTEATLNIGSEFPIPSYTYNSERGSFEVSGFQYKPIGIILKVTPQVNARGVIKLALEPEISQQADTTSFGGAGGAQIPVISTRKVKTNVSLKDGYTMGIGGLITDSKSNGGTKVPVLGSIPVLGRLFSSKSINNVSTNLLIFITAKTITADGASPEEVFDPRAIASTGMSREDLPGYRAPKGTELFAKPEAAKK